MSKVNLTLNPLVFFNMEFADQVSDIDLRDVDTILKDIGGDPEAITLSDCQARYQELREVDKGFVMAPAEKWIQLKVIAPLRQAKANYILSNYLSTIALCGMTAEMASMLIYDMMLVLSDRISESDQAKLTTFQKFQRKGQQNRIDHLMDFECVGP
ncbi:MAG: hypothetical protein KAU17_16625 [Spirochaetales bacterium]|nr:hypothetical protein [Spirochaetales bacterium]